MKMFKYLNGWKGFEQIHARIVNDTKTKQAFTGDLAEQTKKDAIAAIKSQGDQFIKLLSGNTGELISTLIEQAVSNAKGGAKA